MSVAALSSETRPEEKRLIQTFPIHQYIQSHGGRMGIWFRDLDGDGKVEVCFAGAMSASSGSQLKILWHKGEPGDASYQFSDAGVGFTHIEPIEHGFKAAWKTDARWTIIKFERDNKGSLRFQADQSGSARDAASQVASGKGQAP